MLREGIVLLFGKSADREDGGPVSQRTILPELAFRLLLILKGRGCGWLLQTSWCRNPATKQLLFSVLQLFMSMRMGKCYTFKGQSLENGLYYVFQGIGNILLQRVQNQHGKAQTTEHRVRAKGMHSIRKSVLLSDFFSLTSSVPLALQRWWGKRLKLHSTSWNWSQRKYLWIKRAKARN